MDPERDPVRPEYKEYFCSAAGIVQEVIEDKIRTHLGGDATIRTYRTSEGRLEGYIIKASRPFTTEMEQSLRQETNKLREERERRARREGAFAR